MAGDHVSDITSDRFPHAVLQRSHEVPVVVDFWAEWCGPCRVLSPLLERLAAEAGGAFELVKIDVDANPELSQEFGVQGIPTVIGFRDGVAAARFSGAIPERSLRSWLDDLMPSELDAVVDAARDASINGDTPRAEELFRRVLDQQPDHVEAATGLAGLLIAGGDPDQAMRVLDRLPPNPEVERLQSAARLAASRDSDLGPLERAVDADPEDPAARLALARALASHREFEPALDHLLRVVRGKDALLEEARMAMLDVFGVLGDDHPLVATYRRQLASALY